MNHFALCCLLPACLLGASRSGEIVSDYFQAPLNVAVWTPTNPKGDGVIESTGKGVRLGVPAGASHDPWTESQNQAIRIMQNVNDQNLAVEVKFASAVDHRVNAEGLIVEENSNNFVRCETYHDGTTARVFVANVVDGKQSVQADAPLPYSSTQLWLRLIRSGRTWTCSWSANGVVFSPAATFDRVMKMSAIGPFASNYSTEPDSAPALNAVVEHFVNLVATPTAGAGGPAIEFPVVLPGAGLTSFSWTTDAPSSSRIDFGDTAGYGLLAVDSALVTHHSIAIAGLACGTTYHYRMLSANARGTVSRTADNVFTTLPCTQQAAN